MPESEPSVPATPSEPEPKSEPDATPDPVTTVEPHPSADAAPETPPAAALWDPADPDDASDDAPVLVLEGIGKRFGDTAAVEALSLTVEPGTFYGLVGPNGAGKTTTLSMIAGMLRADAGSIRVCGVDVRTHEREAKRLIGVLPDRLRTFDRLTGRQLLTYAGLLRGLRKDRVDERVAALTTVLELDDALGRIVSDYSAGMTKKLMLAAAMIHAPRLLVLDEPFEAVDPASSVVILDLLRSYVAAGGSVVLSSHGIDLIERVCDRVAVIAGGRLVADGPVDEIRGEATLEERFVELVGGLGDGEGLEWLHTFSD